jgi:hypothetical protein
VADEDRGSPRPRIRGDKEETADTLVDDETDSVEDATVRVDNDAVAGKVAVGVERKKCP